MTSDDESSSDITQRWVTSSKLSRSKVRACWVLGILLLGSGIAATFTGHDGAGAATMILFGGLLLVLALMERMPLKFEMAGAKLDASYERDRAYEAGREGGLTRGLDTAISEVEAAIRAGEVSPDGLLDRLRGEREVHAGPPADDESQFGEPASLDSIAAIRVGYRGPTACAAAGITYRQLDYWARTGMVTPSARPKDGGSRQNLYTLKDIALLKLAKRLLDAGISLSQVRVATGTLRERQFNELGDFTILSDGQAVYFAKSPDEVIDLLASNRGIFGIAMGGILRELESILPELPAEPVA